jgi:predicted Ser/Thr protein kinase
MEDKTTKNNLDNTNNFTSLVTKDYNLYKNIFRTQISNKMAFLLEINCLLRLQKYDCFPKVIKINYKRLRFKMENCGISFRKLKNSNFKMSIKNHEEQIDKMIDALRKERIYHLDMAKNGKNLLIKNGKLYMIDFDIACIDNKFLSRLIRFRFKFNNSEEYYNHLKLKILFILQSNPNLIIES